MDFSKTRKSPILLQEISRKYALDPSGLYADLSNWKITPIKDWSPSSWKT